MTAFGEHRQGADSPRAQGCGDVEAWVRGERPEHGDDAVFELHLESCTSCRGRFLEIRALMAAKPAVDGPFVGPPVPVTVWRPRVRDLAVAAVLLGVLVGSATWQGASLSVAESAPAPPIVGRPVTPASVRVEQQRRGFGERRFASLVQSGPVLPARRRRAMRWESP